MSNVRVSYSGLLAFFIGIVSVFTGIFFVLIITRRLTPDEFGTWVLIGTMITYFLVSERIVSFWTLRQISRDEDIGTSSLVTSLFLSLLSIPLYSVLAYSVSINNSVDLDTILFGAIMIPAFFISQTLVSINTGFQPHNTSWSLLIFEIFKIPLALLFIFFLDLGIEGAIITLTLSYLVRILIQIRFAKSKLNLKISLKEIKRWFRLSWIPFYTEVSQPIFMLDVMFYSLISTSVLGLAYYSAALHIAFLVKYAMLIPQGLYPKLLAKGNLDHIKENFSLMMYFSIPLLGLSIIFSKPAVFALNPEYEIAAFLVPILAFKIFFFNLHGFAAQVLRGIEQIDLNDSTLSKLIKSKLFSLPTIRFTQSIVYITTFAIVITLLNLQNSSEIELVTFWVIISLIVEIPFAIYLLIILKRNVSFSLPVTNMIKYVGATLIFSIVYAFTSESIITYDVSLFNFMPGLIIQAIICISVYFIITLIVDSKTRLLFKKIISEVSSKKIS